MATLPIVSLAESPADRLRAARQRQLEDLLVKREIYAKKGHPTAPFDTQIDRLRRQLNGEVVKQEPKPGANGNKVWEKQLDSLLKSREHYKKAGRPTDRIDREIETLRRKLAGAPEPAKPKRMPTPPAELRRKRIEGLKNNIASYEKHEQRYRRSGQPVPGKLLERKAEAEARLAELLNAPN